MAGFLPKPPAEFHRIPHARVAIIGSMWHPHCVDAMIARAQKELHAVGVSETNIQVHHVPGALELPYAARQLFEAYPELDAVIAFGVVLKGATTHDDMVLQNVVDGFARVTDRYNKPIINEVIGVKTVDDAERRSDETQSNKGLEAVFALSELLHWQSTLQS